MGKLIGKMLKGFIGILDYSSHKFYDFLTWSLRGLWNLLSRVVWVSSLAGVILIGVIIGFLGELILLTLGFIFSLVIIALKGFSMITYRIMVTTKTKLEEFNSAFYSGINSVFKEEGEDLEKELLGVYRIPKNQIYKDEN